MSDHDLNREIEEGLKRSEEMLRKQKTICMFIIASVIFMMVLLFAVIGIENLNGIPSPVAPEQKTATATVLLVSSQTQIPHTITKITPINTDSSTVEPSRTVSPTLARKTALIGLPTVTQTIALLAKCVGGDVSGTWNGVISNYIDKYPYTMVLKQDGCQVTGTSWTAETDGTMDVCQVKGSVGSGSFSFTEYGDPSWCYFAGSLTFGENSMVGEGSGLRVTLARK